MKFTQYIQLDEDIKYVRRLFEDATEDAAKLLKFQSIAKEKVKNTKNKEDLFDILRAENNKPLIDKMLKILGLVNGSGDRYRIGYILYMVYAANMKKGGKGGGVFKKIANLTKQPGMEDLEYHDDPDVRRGAIAAKMELEGGDYVDPDDAEADGAKDGVVDGEADATATAEPNGRPDVIIDVEAIKDIPEPELTFAATNNELPSGDVMKMLASGETQQIEKLLIAKDVPDEVIKALLGKVEKMKALPPGKVKDLVKKAEEKDKKREKEGKSKGGQDMNKMFSKITKLLKLAKSSSSENETKNALENAGDIVKKINSMSSEIKNELGKDGIQQSDMNVSLDKIEQFLKNPSEIKKQEGALDSEITMFSKFTRLTKK